MGASILRVKDDKGNIINIPAIKGDKGDNYVLTPEDKQEIANMVDVETVVVDQSYEPESKNAQSGKAVAQALLNKADVDYLDADNIYLIQSNDEVGQDLDGIYGISSISLEGEHIFRISLDTVNAYVVAEFLTYTPTVGDKVYVKASDTQSSGGWVYANQDDFKIVLNLSHKANKVDLNAAIKEEDTSIKEYIDTKNGNLQGFETVSEYVESTINGINNMANDALMIAQDNKTRLDNINLTTSKALSYIEGSSNYVPYIRTTSPINGEYTITLVEGSLIDFYMITTDFGGFDIYNPTFEVSAGDKVHITYTYPESEPDGIWHFAELSIRKDKYVTEEQLTPTEVKFMSGQTIRALNNVEFVGNESISELTIKYPETNFICSFYFTLLDEGDITIAFPNTTKYIGGIPEFKNGETWEINIKNGVVVAGKVVEE